jgi:hypothetical protein
MRALIARIEEAAGAGKFPGKQTFEKVLIAVVGERATLENLSGGPTANVTLWPTKEMQDEEGGGHSPAWDKLARKLKKELLAALDAKIALPAGYGWTTGYGAGNQLFIRVTNDRDQAYRRQTAGSTADPQQY